MSEMVFSTISAVEDVNHKSQQVNLSQDTSCVKEVETVVAETKEINPSVQKSKSNKRGYPINDVELKFELNRDTDELTVFVVDKSSKSVLRTIPPEELANLDAGDLLEITA